VLLILIALLCCVAISSALLSCATVKMSSSNTSSRNEELFSVLSAKISEAIGRKYEAQLGASGMGGGGGAAVGTITDGAGSDLKFFCKRAGLAEESMLLAEYQGLKEMAETKTVKVPRPICAGTVGSTSFAVFEYLDMGGGSRGGDSSRELGRALARMHRCTSPNGQYGFHVDNTW
jgi:fructosamine-3-kinase